MNVARSSPAIDGAFDEFLFAPIGDEANGMALSVLSALTRLDIDPWADAARLSNLPKDSAIVALGQSIARLPMGAWQPADITSIATRLVELLPKPDGAKPTVARLLTKPADWKRRTTVVLALLSVGLGVYLLIGGFSGVEHHSATGRPVDIQVDDRPR